MATIEAHLVASADQLPRSDWGLLRVSGVSTNTTVIYGTPPVVERTVVVGEDDESLDPALAAGQMRVLALMDDEADD